MLNRDVGQRNILLQERRKGSAGDVSDLASPSVEHLISVASDAAFSHLQSDQNSLHSGGFRLLERGSAHELDLLHLAKAVKPGFPDVYRIGNLVPVERQFAFEAQRVARAQATGYDAEFLARS